MVNRFPADAYLLSRPLLEQSGYSEDCVIAQPTPGVQRKIREYLDNGVVLFESAISVDFIDEFLADLKYITTNHTRFHRVMIDGKAKHYKKSISMLSDAEVSEPGLKLVHLHRHSTAAYNLALNPTVGEFLKAMFGCPPALLQSLTFFKSSEQSIHQDFCYVYQQRDLAKLAACWIPLEDIHADAGPLVYYPRSHKVEQYGFFDWGGGSICLDRDSPAVTRGAEYPAFLQEQIRKHGFERKTYLPKKGDLLIWHGALIHGGTPMNNPALTRKSFVCHYTSLESHPALLEKQQNNAFAFESPAFRSLEDEAAATRPEQPVQRSAIRKAIGALKRRVIG